MIKFVPDPEIHYKDGVAIKVITHFNMGGERGFIRYSLREDRKITRAIWDPEGFNNEWYERPMNIPYLEALERSDPHAIPPRRVLGSDRETVDAILAEKRRTARHVE